MWEPNPTGLCHLCKVGEPHQPRSHHNCRHENQCVESGCRQPQAVSWELWYRETKTQLSMCGKVTSSTQDFLLASRKNASNKDKKIAASWNYQGITQYLLHTFQNILTNSINLQVIDDKDEFMYVGTRTGDVMQVPWGYHVTVTSFTDCNRHQAHNHINLRTLFSPLLHLLHHRRNRHRCYNI